MELELNIGIPDVTRIGTHLRETILGEMKLKFAVKKIILEAIKRAIRYVDQ